jgi:hypothetical protein
VLYTKHKEEPNRKNTTKFLLNFSFLAEDKVSVIKYEKKEINP